MSEETVETLQRKLDLALRERDAARRALDDDMIVKHRLNTRIKILEDALKAVQRKVQNFSVVMSADIMELFCDGD